MKDTLAGFRSEFLTWKNSITLAAISLQATVTGTKFMEEIRDNVTALSDEIRGNITALSKTVKSLDEKVTRVHGHVTKTALPSLSSRLDILDKRATRVPLHVAGEPPPSLTPEPNDVAGEPLPSLPPEPNTALPPAALPVVLPSDPPDETMPMPPRVPARSPAMVVAERAHQLAPPHFLPRLHMASPGSTTGNSGDKAPIAEPPNPLANSRVAFAALRARMSQEATDKNIGHCWKNESARPSPLVQ